MSSQLLFIVAICIAFSESCYDYEPGTRIVTHLDLLRNDPNTILLTITVINRNDDYGNEYCKKMSVSDGSVGHVVSCNQKIREWSQPDVDPTSTSINSLKNIDGQISVSMSRNNQDLNIEFYLPEFDMDKNYSSEILNCTRPCFLYDESRDEFTINSIYTTFVYIDDIGTFAIIFDSDYSNNYTIQYVHVTRRGSDVDWRLFTQWSTGSDFGVFDSMNLIEMNLPGFGCSNNWILPYELDRDMSNNEYNVTFEIFTSAYRYYIDKQKQRMYGYAEEFVYVYNAIDGELKRFEPDLSSDTVMYVSIAIAVLFLFLCCVIICRCRKKKLKWTLKRTDKSDTSTSDMNKIQSTEETRLKYGAGEESL